MPSTHGHLHRLATAAGLVASLLAAAACAGGGGGRGGAAGGAARITVPLAPGRVVAPSPVACFASDDWELAAGVWELRGVADLACHLAAPAPPGLTFQLVPVTGSRLQSYQVSWDGQPLAVDEGSGSWTVGVPRSLLAAGRHVLSIERLVVSAADDPRGAFARLAWSVRGGGGGALSPDRRRADARVADFLLHGVTGRDTRLAGGVLFTAPGAVELDLPPGARRMLVEPGNLSPTLASFRAVAGPEGTACEVAVLPGHAGELALDLPPGTRRLRLEVEGTTGGAFLWRGLRVERQVADGEPAVRPPIVVISLDTTRRDALGVYGGTATPRLDAFAATATVYTGAASTSSWTLPAHASLLTGLHPGRHGAGVTRRSLGGPGSATPTLSELLAGAGYLSAGVAGGHLVSHRFGVGRGFTWFHDPDGFASPGSRVTALAEQELDRLAGGGGAFFLFVHYFDAHYPYLAPLTFRRRSGEPQAARALAGLADWPRAADGDIEAWRSLLDRREPVPAAARRWLERAYRAEIGSLDAQVGRLLDALARRGLLDPALVVVTADHGELLGERDRLSHGFGLDPELVEIPLLVKWPRQRWGRRVGGLVSLVDLFPTLLAAAGVAPPPGDGIPLENGRRADAGRPRVFFEEHESRVHPLVFRRLRISDHLFGVATAGRRRVVWEGGGECADRIAGAWRLGACPDDGEDLLARLRERLGATGSAAPAAAGELSDEQRRQLRALGYL